MNIAPDHLEAKLCLGKKAIERVIIEQGTHQSIWVPYGDACVRPNVEGVRVPSHADRLQVTGSGRGVTEKTKV